jgi:opacity protein-like surface antigen
MQKTGWVLAVCGAMAIGATDAQAQMSMGSFRGYLTGHVGTLAGGDASGGTFVGGASISVHETNGWGAEIDFGHASGVDTAGPRLDVNSYMLNAVFTAPDRKIRPFALVGAGVVQAEGCFCDRPSKTYDFGISAGAGAVYLLNDIFAVRGDLRWFWSDGDHPDLGRPENFKFWRASIGFTYMWTIAP